jgi:MICOS complex subunit MIC13
LPELPSSNEIGFLTTHYYNQAVKSSIKFIEMLPCYAGQGVKKIKDSVEKAMEVPPPK